MGLVVSRYRAREPLALLPALRERTEVLLGASVALAVEPARDVLRVRGRAVTVVDRGTSREMHFAGSWLDPATRAEVTRMREVLTTELGAEERRRWSAFHYRFAHPASIEAIARALGGEITAHHHGWAHLRSGLRTSVEIELDEHGFELQAPVVIFGRLYDRAIEAADALAERIPLGAPR